MAVNFAKMEEERLPVVLSMNDEVSLFQIPCLTEALAPACPAKPKILLMEVSREDEADLQILIPVILCFTAEAFFAG